MKTNKKIVLIGCSSRKIHHPDIASKLYNGCYFRACYKYSEALLTTNNIDRIYILSAKHHIVEPSDYLEPYNYSLKMMNNNEREQWSKTIIQQLKDKDVDLDNDEFIIFTGENYYKLLIPYFKHYSIPLNNIQICQRMKILYNKRIELIGK